MSEVDKKIKTLKTELDSLEAESVALNSLSRVERLAIHLHEKMCHYNHADGCSWHYEIYKGIHDFTRPAHVRYYDKARDLIMLDGDLVKLERIVDAISK